MMKKYDPIVWQKKYGYYKLDPKKYTLKKYKHYYSDPNTKTYIFTMYGEKYDENVELDRPLLYKFEVWLEKTDEGYMLTDSGNIYINGSELDDEYTENEDRNWEQEDGLGLYPDEIYQDSNEIAQEVYEKALEHFEGDKSKGETSKNMFNKK